MEVTLFWFIDTVHAWWVITQFWKFNSTKAHESSLYGAELNMLSQRSALVWSFAFRQRYVIDIIMYYHKYILW